jgi:predicted nucleotidyltransferase
LLEHHRATIERANATIAARDETLAVLVGGSIAHGFETPASDVDVMLVVSDDDYRRRLESATYEGGYVDGKYISVDFIRTVAERGNEPSRFAF